MAAKRGEETKTPLIVSLVIFVILTILLGVGAYFGFAKQEEYQKAEKDAKKDAAAKADSRDWHRMQNVLLKSYVGHPLTKEDQEQLISQWPNFENANSKLGSEKGDNRADFDGLVKKLNDPALLGWNNEKKQPNRTFLELVKEKDQRITDLTNQVAQAKRDNQAVQTELANAKKIQEETEKNLNDQLQKAKAETAELINKYDAEFKKYTTTVENLHNQVDDSKRSEEKTKDETGRQVAKVKKELSDTRIQLDQERKKLSPPDVMELDNPKGKVIDVDRGGEIVYINLGSADNLKPQVTFSIYSAGANSRGAQRKGSLEVTNILGPHIAKTRVTELTDANLQPVVRGDLLFNPAWNPKMRQHIAIAGLVDLTGDATDDTPAFIRGLERLGIVVDSYIDLKDLKIKGTGMNLETQYLVVGDEPKFNEMGVVNQADVTSARKHELNTRMSEMRDEAKRLGITVVPYRRFLALAGYPTPPSISSTHGTFLDSGSLGVGKPKETEKKEPMDK